MSKKEKKEEQEVTVIKGRPRARTDRRKGAKKIDLTASAELFDIEFYMYFPEPGFDTTEYQNADGTVDIDSIPDEHVVEFKCRYIDPGTLQKLAKTPFAWDLPDLKNKSEQEIQDIVFDSLKERDENFKPEEEFRADVLHTCILEPQFESSDQIQKIIPTSIQTELYLEITKGAIGENLVARFSESN